MRLGRPARLARWEPPEPGQPLVSRPFGTALQAKPHDARRATWHPPACLSTQHHRRNPGGSGTDHDGRLRPTFAIDLERSSAAIPTPAAGSYLPQRNNEGLLRRWSTWTTQDPGGWAAFIGSMVGTWQGWVDNEALRMPGYRDRVVTIYSTADEGGMNLNMEPSTVQALADRGAFAATRLVTKFTGLFGPAQNTGLDNHRWIRFRVALAGLSDNGVADYGLVLAPGFWGLGASVTELALEYGFNELALSDVTIALPLTRNPGAALGRLGFRADGGHSRHGRVPAVPALRSRLATHARLTRLLKRAITHVDIANLAVWRPVPSAGTIPTWHR